VRRNWLIIAVTAAIVVTVVILGARLHQTNEQEILSQFQELSLSHARQVAHEIEYYFRTRTLGLQALSSFTSLQYGESEERARDIRAYFEHVRKVHVAAISVFDKTGTIVYSTNESRIGSSYPQSDFFIWAQEKTHKGKVFVSPIMPAGKEPGPYRVAGAFQPRSFPVLLATPIYQEAVDAKHPNATGQLAGVLVFAVDIGELIPSGPGESVYSVWIIAGDGTLLLQSEHPEMKFRNVLQAEQSCSRCHSSFDYARKILAEKQGTAEYQLRGFPKKLAAFAPMEFENAFWIVVVGTPYDSVSGVIRHNLYSMLLLLGVVFVALVAGSTMIQRNHRSKLRAEQEAQYWQEKHTLEEKIRESELRYRTIVETAHDLIWILDRSGNFVFVNKRAEELSGHELSELEGNAYLPLVHPEDQPKVENIFLETLEGKSNRYEVKVLKKDGRILTLSVNTVPLYEQDRIIGTVNLGRDITEHKQAEKELQRTNQELSTLHAIDRTVNQTLDLQVILNFCVDKTMEILHAEAGGIYLLQEDGKTMLLVVHRGLSDEFVRNIEKVQLGEGVSGRAAAERKPIILDVAGYPFGRLSPFIVEEGYQTLLSVPLLAKDRVLGVINLGSRRADAFPKEKIDTLLSIGMNIGTAVDNALLFEELQRTEERYRGLVESSPDAIVVFSEDTLTFANQAAAKLAGVAGPEQLIGKPIMGFVHPDHRERARESIRQLRKGMAVPLTELQLIRSDGQVADVEIAAIHIRGAQSPAVQLVIRDVTEKKQLQAQFLQSQKIEAVGRLAGGVAHDFNNILMAISGYCELLLFKMDPADAFHREVNEVLRASQQGAALTNQLLAFSRKQVLEPKILDLNRVVTQVEKMLCRLIGEDIELITVLEPKLGYVKVDAGQIEQVIMNLAVNARDAMPEGGKLIIETRNVELDREIIPHISEVPRGRYVLLSVADTGCGMDEATQSRIFEPFFTTKEQGKGTGLGLATVYGIVKQSGGYIVVYSEPGHGTIFKIYLSRIDQPEETARVHEGTPVALLLGQETILLADDNEPVRLAVGSVLQMYGYTVLQAEDGRNALEVSRQHNGEIHLLITDAIMPEMGGRELAERLILERPQIKVLFMSGYTDEAVQRQGILTPGASFLQKPASMEVLLRKVRELLDKKP
jgi:PAS domain S-box-containing protein